MWHDERRFFIGTTFLLVRGWLVRMAPCSVMRAGGNMRKGYAVNFLTQADPSYSALDNRRRSMWCRQADDDVVVLELKYLPSPARWIRPAQNREQASRSSQTAILVIVPDGDIEQIDMELGLPKASIRGWDCLACCIVILRFSFLAPLPLRWLCTYFAPRPASVCCRYFGVRRCRNFTRMRKVDNCFK